MPANCPKCGAYRSHRSADATIFTCGSVTYEGSLPFESSDLCQRITGLKACLATAEANLAEVKKKLTAMHRRCQRAEAGLPAWEQIKAKSDGTVKGFSRALLVATIQKLEAERDRYKKTILDAMETGRGDAAIPCESRECGGCDDDQSPLCDDYLSDFVERAHAHIKDNEALATERDALLKLTESLDSHPDDYDGPCWCKTCQSYAAENHDPNA